MFNKKIAYYSFLVFLLIAILPLVSSKPTVTVSTIGGLEILFPNYEYLQQNEGYDFYWHLFNETGLLTNTSATCYFHLYSKEQESEHIFTANNVKTFTNNRDFEVSINATNFSTSGDYCVLIECNTSVQTGGVEKCFEVTPKGIEITTGRAILDFGMLLILVIFLIGTVFIFIESNNLLAKVGTVGFGYLLLIAITFVSWNVSSDFIISNGFVAEMFRILFITLIVMAFPLLIGAFAWYVIMLFKIKEIERLMDKGFSEDEANRRIKNGKK
jgi:hypothetical protein